MTKRVRLMWSVVVVLVGVLAWTSLGASRAYALAKGQSFKAGGNTYKITEYDVRDREYEVTLVSRGLRSSATVVK